MGIAAKEIADDADLVADRAMGNVVGLPSLDQVVIEPAVEVGDEGAGLAIVVDNDLSGGHLDVFVVVFIRSHFVRWVAASYPR
ncbi:MAG: hypothetical protein JNL84_08220 [Candidatus Accumulibacter sp.]|nr:hypothetical protein [Accumulibacter sp.]